MAKNIDQTCRTPETYLSFFEDKNNRFGSFPDLIDWSRPESSAWTNFSSEFFSSVEFNYVKDRWKYYQEKYPSAGKLIFFDIVNLAPTEGEVYGNDQTPIINEPQPQDARRSSTYFYYGLPPLNNIRYVSTGSFKSLFSRKTGRRSENEPNNASFLQSETALWDFIESNGELDQSSKDIDDNPIIHPIESEFKLPWMRNLVEAGIEERMGPFYAKTGSNGSPIKNSDGRVQFKIDQSSFDIFIKYKDDYKEAIWQEWLESEYKLATENPQKYKSLKRPKVPLRDLELLRAGINLDDPRSQYPRDTWEDFTINETGYGRNFIDNDSRPEQVTDALLAFLLPVVGTEEVITPSVVYTTLDAEKNVGVMANVSNDPQITNITGDYTVTGWIKLLNIYGQRTLPWAFVWKYIVRDGIWQYSEFKQAFPREFKTSDRTGDALDETQLAKLQEEINELYYEWYSYVDHTKLDGKSVVEKIDKQNEKKNFPKLYTQFDTKTGEINFSGNDIDKQIDKQLFVSNNAQFFKYDARSRFWYWRYAAKEVPDRELFFWIRYKYGAAAASRARFIATSVVPQTKQIEKIYECGGIVAGETTVLGGRYYSFNDYEDVTPANNNRYTWGYRLRSGYICHIHDLDGYPVVDYEKYNELPTPNSAETLDGDLSEVDGYFSLTGGYSDRRPTLYGPEIGDNRFASSQYSLKQYKQTLKTKVRSNHIPLSRLLKSSNTDPIGEQGFTDRYISVDYPISSVFVNKPENGEVETLKRVFYHNHSSDYIFNYKDTFYPAFYTDKELQFLYELVSYVYYGKINTSTTFLLGSTTTKLGTIFDRSELNMNRWAELGSIVSAIKARGSLSKLGPFDIPTDIDSSSPTNIHSYLMDYILWAAPTSGQFNKVKYSTLGDISNSSVSDSTATFVKRYKEKVSSSDDYWTNPNLYPVHAFAKQIIDSEDSERPMVPAWVHYKYISRVTGEQKKGSSVVSTESIADDDIRDNIRRVLGGKYEYSLGLGYRNTDQGQLIVLPRFVLGGRLDLGEKIEETWDKEWGDPIFDRKDGQLVITRDLDAVLDAWAKGEKHNGKYVSAMEILFWLKYRRGLASAPGEQKISWPAAEQGVNGRPMDGINDIDYRHWPIEGFVYIDTDINEKRINVGGGEVNDGEVIWTESLHGVPILTSYYHPILSDGVGSVGVSELNRDPLMEIKPTPRIKDKLKTAYTGWNSKYVAHWKGTGVKEVYTLRGEGGFSQSHTSPYLNVFKLYTANQGSGKTLLYGFSNNKVMNTSDIQTWFRVSKIVKIQNTYAKYVANGLQKPEGTKGSVIPVKADTLKSEKDTSAINSIVFISGDPKGHRYTGEEDFSEEHLLVRPWTVGYDTNSEAGIALLDDYSVGTKNCMPQYHYMRHIIQPMDIMYFYPPEFSKKRWYSNMQNTKTANMIFPFAYRRSTNVLFDDSLLDLEQIPQENRTFYALLLAPSSEISAYASRVGTLTEESKRLSRLGNATPLLVAGSKGISKISKLPKLLWTTGGWWSKQKSIFTTLEPDLITRYTDEINMELALKSKQFDDFYKFKIDYPLFALKLATGIIGRTNNREDFTDRETGWYLGLELSAKIVNEVIKDHVKHLFSELISEAVEKNIMTRAVNLARGFAISNIAVTIVFEVIAWQIGLIIEDINQEDKLQKMDEYIRTAYKEGWVEGPYLESKGTIKIRKGSDGSIGGNYDIKKDEIVKLPAQLTDGTGFFSKPVPDRSIGSDIAWNTAVNDYVKQYNRKFYTGYDPYTGKTDTPFANIVGNNLKSGSCECHFLVNLFSETETFINAGSNDRSRQLPDKGTPYNRKNWKTGAFKRHWGSKTPRKTLESIIDDAPIFSDIPVVFQRNPRPSVDTELLLDVNTQQVSSEEIPSNWVQEYMRGNIPTNFRLEGEGGTQVKYISDCPRFWWPNLLPPSVNDDLCDYIPLNGRYPKRKAKTFVKCDGKTQRELLEKIAQEKENSQYLSVSPQKYARTLCEPNSVIDYISSNTLRDNSKTGNNSLNKIELGNTIYSLYDVNGVAPPHEREISRIFRMKYRIDIVDPRSNCCSIGEVIFPEESTRGINLLDEKSSATNCNYIIKLNDARFHKIVLNACTLSKPQDDSEEKTQEAISKETTGKINKPDLRVIDNNVISGSTTPPPPPPPGGYDDRRRKKRSRRIPPCIPPAKCEEPPTPPGVESSGRIPYLLDYDTTIGNTPPSGFKLSTTGTTFGGLSYPIPEEPLSNPLQPVRDQETMGSNAMNQNNQGG